MDLFAHYDKLPEQVRTILDKYSSDDCTYKTCEQMLKEMEEAGFTFEYGLDAVPFGLKKISSSGQ